jgi:hypothetical protein
MRSSRISVLVATAAALLSTSALAHHMTPLPSRHGWDAGKSTFQAPPRSNSGTWAGLTNTFPGAGFPDTALQLTDGSILMHDGCTTDWYKLSPDNTGSYANGTWTKKASMPSGYSPLYFASQVLADGRVIVNGGEYINCSQAFSKAGALYDPVADSWTNVNPPTGWTKIGDSGSVVLQDGTYMLANCCTTQEAKATISGTTVTFASTGTGKADSNDEEGWTMLPNQTVMVVDANKNLGGSSNTTEIYTDANPSGSWAAGNNTANSLVDAGSHEIGPAPLLPNGLVFQIGGTAHTGVFDPSSGNWTAGPDGMTIGGMAMDSSDGPAAVLTCGRVLEQVSPGVFQTPSHFVEVTVNSTTSVTQAQVNEPASAASQSSYEGRLMVLPTGQILWSSDIGDVQIYTPKKCNPVASSKPKIKTVAASLAVGSANNNLKGVGLNGVTFGGYYGDDAQMSTNYPLVRITNSSSHHVCYARTHDHSRMGLATAGNVTTKFDIPNTCETGDSQLVVVVNGVASKAKVVTLH